MSRQKNTDDVTQCYPQVHSRVVVDLRWRPEQSDRRHERGQKGHRHWDHVHVPSGHQEVFDVLLLPILDGVKHANDRRNKQGRYKNDVIYSTEGISMACLKTITFPL